MRFVLLAFVTACTSSAGGGVMGMPPGGGYEPSATVSASVTTSDGGGGSSYGQAMIVLSSEATACSDAGAMPPIERKGSRATTITLMDVSGGNTAAPTAPGTFTIYPNSGSQPPKEALFDMTGLDGACNQVDADAAQGQSGTVTLTSVSGGVFTGTFDVVLNTGDHVTGSFAPTACPALQAVAAPSQQPACN